MSLPIVKKSYDYHQTVPSTFQAKVNDKKNIIRGSKPA